MPIWSGKGSVIESEITWCTLWLRDTGQGNGALSLIPKGTLLQGMTLPTGDRIGGLQRNPVVVAPTWGQSK